MIVVLLLTEDKSKVFSKVFFTSLESVVFDLDWQSLYFFIIFSIVWLGNKMWKSLFMDMYESLADGCKDMNEAVVLAVHIFNVAKGMQCTGLQEDDPACGDILPEGWNSNPQLYSFRYSSKSLTIYEKLLRVNPVKINIHAVRSDQNDKIFHFSVDLTEIASDYEGTEFTESLIEKVSN